MTERYRPFGSVLVANRGEIAVRVLRAAKVAGLRSIAVVSDADVDALHALTGDTCVVIGPGPAKESYLNAARVLAAARETGAEAVHPGYGFFAENADFARQVEEAGLVWIGPPPNVIERLGDKLRAKALARDAGVPVVPGFEGAADDLETLRPEADAIGYPLLVKAAAGGGGRGMRVVRTADDLEEALAAAAREAEAAFGSGRVFLEKLVAPARHVEVQVFADAHGNVVHLGERECSVQRRYQKIVEESPSPAVDDALRARMGDAAVSLTKAAGYVGAGTVEFLLGPDGAFYFLEVNTRLQVEHPVTELVTARDLVCMQFDVAAGKPLDLEQDAIHSHGHAIEVRVCAEDPAHSFAPQSGRIVHLELPTAPGVRIDSGVHAEQEIPPHYDSLVLKLLAHGATREMALARACGALDELLILGPETNVAYLRAILAHDAFRAGDISTSFLDEHFAGWGAGGDGVPEEVLIAAATGELLARSASNGIGAAAAGEPAPTAWTSLAGWRIAGHAAGDGS